MNTFTKIPGDPILKSVPDQYIDKNGNTIVIRRSKGYSKFGARKVVIEMRSKDGEMVRKGSFKDVYDLSDSEIISEFFKSLFNRK